MNFDCDNISNIYKLTKLLICKEIKLSAWNKNENREILALFMGDGEFVFYYFTEEKPILKQVPWFSDVENNPISICFNPSGTFLLVLSQYGHLYIIPVLFLFNPTSKNDQIFDVNDLTLFTYPFPMKVKQSKSKVKSPNSSQNAKSSVSCHSSSSGSSSSDLFKRVYSFSNTNESIEAKTNENFSKLKAIKSIKTEIEPVTVVWWQSSQNFKPTAIIGTKLGEIIFVDLNTGVKVFDTTVNGPILRFSICEDEEFETSLLLITLENKTQYKIILEQKDMNFLWSKKESNHPSEENDNAEEINYGKNNYLPSARSRLQGLKQLSVEKIANLKQKIAESRSKSFMKEEISEDYNPKFCSLEPDFVWGRFSEIILSPQLLSGRFAFAGYHSATHLLTVHTMALDAPLSKYRLPPDIELITLCDYIILTVSTNGSKIKVISSQISQSKNSCSDFNPNSVLETWELNEDADENGEDQSENVTVETESETNLLVNDNPNSTSEKVIACYRRCEKEESFDFLEEEYNLIGKKEEFLDFPKIENCIIVTNKNIYLLERTPSIVKIALNWILKTKEYQKVEMICMIFRINIRKLLELAGDIKLASLDLTQAIALYRESEIGLLKIAVKLSADGHSGQLLKYAMPIMSDSLFFEMSIIERIHFSNLMLMAYTQQILSKENNENLTKSFMDFLKTNPYYDGVLALSVTGQSFLFKCLIKLMIHKGLILDGYTVLIKVIQRFLENKSLQWAVKKNDFWKSMTENCLIEAMIYKSSALPSYAEYVIRNVDSLELIYLNRLLTLTDPTSPYLRSIAYASKIRVDSFMDNDEIECDFPFHKLVELFLIVLLVKINKFRDEEDYNRDLLLPSLDLFGRNDQQSSTGEDEKFESTENVTEHIWPIRKDIKENEALKRKRESFLSCGFGHSALVRNGAVYTWGQTTKGCLGHGPTMSKHSPPQPITWLSSLRLEVTIVSCGKQHTVALTNNGIYAWGCSMYGQLGLGEVYESPHPRLVSALANEDVISVKCGQYHTLALTYQGSVYAWGWGVHGQLGLGTIEDERLPKYVHTLKEQVIVDIAAGQGHSLVLSDKGHVYSFGSSVYGQLGTGTIIKSSVPVLVKGINGIVTIATGYFHNLALTESNTLYIWGISPQSLRRRRQKSVRKGKILMRSALVELDNTAGGSEGSGNSEDVPVIDISEAIHNAEKSEAHLSPSLVDTSDVKGKIVQISCGCHNSALITDSGLLYIWGRSVNQLGNVSPHESLAPSVYSLNGAKIDAVSCGCEFITVQDKQTGKIFNWGSNSVGQLGISAEESAAKSLNENLIMWGSCTRIIRIPQTTTISQPREVPGIPPSSFTYQTLNKHSSVDCFSLSSMDPDGYFTRCLHFALEKYRNIYNVNFILKKCLEFGNYQAASKIALVENKLKQSMIYQLKGLQNIPKYHPKTLMSFEKQEVPKDGAKSPKSEVMTPESEIHLFADQGGKEEMCDETNSQDISNSEDDVDASQKDLEQGSEEIKDEDTKRTVPEENYLNQLKTDYVEHAKFILETYLNLCCNYFGNESILCSILETGIQFWIAEKLPMAALENFLLQKLDFVYFDLGYLLFCQLKRDNQAPVLQQFSSTFLLEITSKLLSHIEKNESCLEYLETMSKIIVSDKPDTKLGIFGGRRKRGGRKPESVVHAITEKLKKKGNNGNYISVPSNEIFADFNYYFSCGHWHNSKSLEDGFKLFDRMSDSVVSGKLLKLYDKMDKTRSGDISCPSCVYNYVK